MKINVSSVCDIGIERTNNEDAVGFCFDLKNHLWNQSSTNDYIPLPTEGAVFVVADGMGGYKGGEIASKLAVACSRSYIENNLKDTPKDKENLIQLIRK